MEFSERQKEVVLELIKIVKDSRNTTDEGILRQIKQILWKVEFFFKDSQQR